MGDLPMSSTSEIVKVQRTTPRKGPVTPYGVPSTVSQALA